VSPRVYENNTTRAAYGRYVAEHAHHDASGDTPERALERLARYFELLAKDCRDEKLRRLKGDV
jgi:hypothetical protein